MVDVNCLPLPLEKTLRIVRETSPAKLSSHFLPLSPRVLMLNEKLTFTLYLKVRKASQEPTEFLPLLARGEVFLPTWRQSLENLGLDRVYICRPEIENLLAYLNNYLVVLGAFDQPVAEKFFVLREHLYFSLQRVFTKPKSGKHISQAYKTLQLFLDCLENDQAPWKFINEILYYDYSLYNHAVNVSFLGLAFLRFLRKNRQDCLLLGLAGLLHDLGLTCLPEDLTYKVETFSPKEKALFQQHPFLGYDLLQDYDRMPEAAKQLVLEHHENADGSGYPHGLTLPQQHPYTRFLRLLDAYDGLTCHRSHRTARTPFEALKCLQNQRGSQGPVFHPPALRSFIRFLAIG